MAGETAGHIHGTGLSDSGVFCVLTDGCEPVGMHFEARSLFRVTIKLLEKGMSER